MKATSMFYDHGRGVWTVEYDGRPDRQEQFPSRYQATIRARANGWTPETNGHAETQTIRGTGERTDVNGADQLDREKRTVADMDEAARAGQHFWVATLAFRCDPTSTRNVYDSNTLTGPPLIGCLICEQEWTPHVAAIGCPGDPADEPGGPW